MTNVAEIQCPTDTSDGLGHSLLRMLLDSDAGIALHYNTHSTPKKIARPSAGAKLAESAPFRLFCAAMTVDT